MNGSSRAVYELTRLFFRLVFRCVLDFRVSGTEHVPARGPAILVANHPCAIDGFLVIAAVRRRVYGWMRAPNFAPAWRAWYLRALGNRPVGAGEDNRDTMAWSEDLLRRGGVLLLGPEGDVTIPPPVGPFKGGFLKIALKLGAPVVPVAIVGSEKILSEPRRPTLLRHHIPHRARVDLKVLPPMWFENPGLDRTLFEAQLGEVRRGIGAAVDDLLRARAAEKVSL
ncbi:MAG TPA: lysophospholipid acyltransferase family protein [Thermoanaerobaculia bacterium]